LRAPNADVQTAKLTEILRMPLDPMLKEFLDQLDAQPGPKMWELNAPEARVLLRTLMQLVGPKDIRAGAVHDLVAPGPRLRDRRSRNP
jgi:hypothetical protein